MIVYKSHSRQRYHSLFCKGIRIKKRMFQNSEPVAICDQFLLLCFTKGKIEFFEVLLVQTQK